VFGILYSLECVHELGIFGRSLNVSGEVTEAPVHFPCS